MTDMTVPSAADAPPVAPTSGEEGNRRGDIIRAAGRLFRQKGYNGTTIRDIADAVGMRSGSPFYHFKSKHEILFTVTTEGIEVMLRNLEMVIAKGQPARECFEDCVATHMNYLLGPGRDFAWVMLYESRLLDPAERAIVHRMSARYEEVFSAVLDRLQASGHLHDASAVARKLILGAINWSAQWYDETGASDPQAIARQLCALVLHEKN
ncbi:MAG: TetR family transcriptional regulator [Rhodocyclaceae bacterium]|nr:TetR family transcriptional regulator [Rhodocyclaceae bacterium]